MTSASSRRFEIRSRDRQCGAVLLAFMLVLVVGSSYLLVSRMNEYAQAYARNTLTQTALADAKKALLFYAMNYPELNNKPDRGPGYLPCPDQDDDGATQSNCADSTGSTLGRLPYSTLGLSELVDSSGERLWYAVSQNFKYNQPGNYVLNSEVPGTISVDGGGDIVAVIIAPGEPVFVQSGRRGSSEAAALAANDLYLVAAEYLEADNATYGDASYVTSDPGEFNDVLVTVTRAELMEVVELRAVNEIRRILAEYKGDYGAYPWLATFADPKSSGKWLRGTHTGSDNSSNLQDSTVDFTQWGITSGDGVTTGDVVWNLTDGSLGRITNVAATTLTIGAMSLGTDNDFDDDDEYYVEAVALSGVLSGSATAGTASVTLKDNTRDFEELGVSPGDVVDDITDGSSGVVDSVDLDELTVSALSGGFANQFAAGDTYRIRNSMGSAKAGSAALTLVDTSVNFVTMGVQAGDLVRNMSDGSYGRVATVAANTLTLNDLDFGTTDSFSVGDNYDIPRFNATTSTRKGLLSLHEPGKAFATGFSVDWSAMAANGNTVGVTTAGTDTTYSDVSASIDSGIEYWIETSEGYSGTVSVPSSSGECLWITEGIAECRGEQIDGQFLNGTVEAVTTSGSMVTITDSSILFPSAGVKRGDKIENVSDGLSGIVNLASTLTPNEIRAINITGASAFNADVGDSFRIYVASGRYNNGAEWTNTGANTACTDNVDFSFTQVDDVVRNSSQGNGVGLITGLFTFGTWGCFTYTDLQGGTSSDVNTGDNYRIYYDYVNERRFRFDVRINGSSEIAGSGGVRQRSVCLGYDDGSLAGEDCSLTSAGNPALSSGNTATISIEDYTAAGTLVGAANVTIPDAGSPQASARLSGIDYYVAEETDGLPEWFMNNKWHRLLYVAYSSEFAPGGDGVCSAGTDCLQLSVALPEDTIYSDREALVIAAGMELPGQASSRTTGALNAYLEDENALPANDLFERGEITTSFNDKVSVVSP